MNSLFHSSQVSCFTKSNHAISLIHMDVSVPFTYVSLQANNYNFSTTVGGPAKSFFSPKPHICHFLVSLPFSSTGNPFCSWKQLFSSYCACSSFAFRAVLNFSMNAKPRSAESFTTAMTRTLVNHALKCDSLSQVEERIWTKVSLNQSAGKTCHRRNEIRNLIFFEWANDECPYRRFKRFTQCQLGEVLQHTLFLLLIRRMPSRPESHRSTSSKWCFMAACTCLATQTTTTSSCIISRSCKNSRSTRCACSVLIARRLAFKQVRATSRHIYKTLFGTRPLLTKMSVQLLISWRDAADRINSSGYYEISRWDATNFEGPNFWRKGMGNWRLKYFAMNNL